MKSWLVIILLIADATYGGYLFAEKETGIAILLFFVAVVISGVVVWEILIRDMGPFGESDLNLDTVYYNYGTVDGGDRLSGFFMVATGPNGLTRTYILSKDVPPIGYFQRSINLCAPLHSLFIAYYKNGSLREVKESVNGSLHEVRERVDETV